MSRRRCTNERATQRNQSATVAKFAFKESSIEEEENRQTHGRRRRRKAPSLSSRRRSKRTGKNVTVTTVSMTKMKRKRREGEHRGDDAIRVLWRRRRGSENIVGCENWASDPFYSSNPHFICYFTFILFYSLYLYFYFTFILFYSFMILVYYY